MTLEKVVNKSILEHLEGLKIFDSLTPSIVNLAKKIKEVFENEGKLLICGNGGSAADAQHLSSELTGFFEKKRKAFHAIALTTDTSAITAIGNDYGFENIFSRQVEALGSKNDIILVISTSGNSANIIKALEAGKKNSLYLASITGRNGGLAMKKSDLSINVNLKRTSRVQEMHILIIHLLCELIEHGE